MSANALSFEPVSLGALALKLDRNGAFARAISLGGEELLRGVGFVVRDANWGTPTLSGEVIVSRQDNDVVATSGGTLDSSGSDLTWSTAWTITDNLIEASGRLLAIRFRDEPHRFRRAA